MAVGSGLYMYDVVVKRSRSLYAIAVPSVCRLSVCKIGGPTQPVEIFGNFSLPFGTLAIH